MPAFASIGRTALLEVVRDHHAAEPQDRHGGEQRPALPRVPHHLAEGVSQSAGDQEDQEHLEQVRERRRVFERMRGVGVEESAAIGAEHLDRFLRCHRSLRDGLFRAFERGRNRIGMQILNHALRAKNQCRNDRDRQQDVQGRPRHVDPEVADGLDRLARESAHQRNRDRRARRPRK